MPDEPQTKYPWTPAGDGDTPGAAPYARVRPPGAEGPPPATGGDAPGDTPEKPPQPEGPRLEEHTAPTTGKKFPCAQCGAALKYAPGTRDLRCDYCGHSQHIPQSEAEVRELDFVQYFEAGNVAESVMEGVEGEQRCKGCGAVVMVPTRKASDFCPFCGGQLEAKLAAATPMMAPEGILPFRVEEREARALFHKWVKSRWFAPNKLKEIDKLHNLRGMYTPYWTYDSMTWSWFTGQRGDYYYVRVKRGNSWHRERRTRWTPVSGRVDHWFDDVLVCASMTLPANLVRELEPWDLKSAEPYTKQYLSGFHAERYQVSAVEGFALAKGVMENDIRELACRRIGGDEQRVHTVKTEYGGVTFKQLLLPVWLAAYKFNDKVYRVLVNARTGEVQGEHPRSWVKISLAVLAAVLTVAAVVLFVMHG